MQRVAGGVVFVGGLGIGFGGTLCGRDRVIALGWMLVGECQWRPGVAQVPNQVAGEQADQYVGFDMVVKAVVDGAQVQVVGLDDAEVTFDADLLRSTVNFCEGRVGPDSIYGVLHRECFDLFADELFADLFTDVGRRSVPPMIVAVVMVLQRIEGLSDREAVERFAFDARWKYAAGGLDFDYPGFVHTVLVDMRARLARSDRPNRIFEVTLEAAKAAGLVGRKRVLDSTPL